MGFWGIEVKPGKPHPYHSDNVEGRLCVTQATLGSGTSTDRTILQCAVGHKNPIFLCSLLPNKHECCSLNLEFVDELVAFSVIGSRSVHLSGYFVSEEGDNLRDEYVYDSAEDLSDSETNSDSSDENEYSDGFDNSIDFEDGDSDDLLESSPVRKSGVVIEEIEEDSAEKEKEDCSKQETKQNSNVKAKLSEQQIVPKCNAPSQTLDSEDEDGFPVSASREAKNLSMDCMKSDEQQINQGSTCANLEAKGKKRKKKNSKQDVTSEPNKKTKKPKETQNLESVEAEMVTTEDANVNVNVSQENAFPNANELSTSNVSEKTSKKKKKKKGQKAEGSKELNTTVPKDEDNENAASKSSQIRNFSNGLVVEELKLGIPDGKKATDGSRVSVQYIGKLKKTGKVFDSNIGSGPFEFRLGVGKVIEGWDVGIKGMRVGDKRRLTIPPSMGYGSKGAGGKIPPNAWLEFDVELVGVR